MTAIDSPLISTEDLHERLGDPKVKVLDATWYLPGTPRDPRAEFEQARIPGAAFFDINAIRDVSTPLPTMVPSPEDFALAVEQLGISDENTVVIYNGGELITAPRAWWMFRLFGHPQVLVLDGGLAKWRAEGRPVESGPFQPPALGRFTPSLDANLLRDLEEVRASLDHGHAQVVDVRPPARFRGDTPEPRPGMRAGHMPGALHLYAHSLVGPDGVFLAPDKLAEAFRAAGVDPDKPVVTTCGSGIAACTVALALARLGHWRGAVYDGSWSEWGGRQDTPVVIGP